MASRAVLLCQRQGDSTSIRRLHQEETRDSAQPTAGMLGALKSGKRPRQRVSCLQSDFELKSLANPIFAQLVRQGGSSFVAFLQIDCN